MCSETRTEYGWRMTCLQLTMPIAVLMLEIGTSINVLGRNNIEECFKYVQRVFLYYALAPL